MPNEQDVVDAFSEQYLDHAGINLVEIGEEDGEPVLRVGTTDPDAAARVLPMTYEGLPVRMFQTGEIVAQEEASSQETEVLTPRRPEAPALRPPWMEQIQSAQQVDEELWRAIDSGSDPLQGMNFALAVTADPLRVEALVHQRIHRAFYDILGLPPGSMGQSMAGQAQRETYFLRNRTIRALHGNRPSARVIADSLERNWEDYSRLLDVTLLQARMGVPGAEDYVNRVGGRMRDLMRAFREASAIAMRARDVAEGDEQDGWMRISCVMRNMAQYVEERMLAPAPPRRRGLLGHG